MFHYDYHSTIFDNVQRYVNDKNVWNDTDLLFYNSLGILNKNVGPERKKYKEFFQHVETKVIAARDRYPF